MAFANSNTEVNFGTHENKKMNALWYSKSMGVGQTRVAPVRLNPN